jgi:hypothetical protein
MPVHYHQIVHLAFKRDETTGFLRLFSLLLGVPTCIHALFNNDSGGIVRFLKTLLRFYATLGSSILLYRLSPWHPIARYPGPLLCKASKVYWAIISRDGNQHKRLAALHGIYGDIVRIGMFISAVAILRIVKFEFTTRAK